MARLRTATLASPIPAPASNAVYILSSRDLGFQSHRTLPRFPEKDDNEVAAVKLAPVPSLRYSKVVDLDTRDESTGAAEVVPVPTLKYSKAMDLEARDEDVVPAPVPKLKYSKAVDLEARDHGDDGQHDDEDNGQDADDRDSQHGSG